MADEKRLFERILVPVDGSRYSLEAVLLAARLAVVHGSSLLLLHVLDEAVMQQLSRLGGRESDSVRHEMVATAKGVLHHMAREAEKCRVPVATDLKEGTPHEVILREAEQWGADLIVMGKLGRRGVSRILLGSVAERVIEFAKLPVLLVNS